MKSFKLSILAIATFSCHGYAQDTEEQPLLEIVPDHLAYLYAAPPEEVNNLVAYQLYAERRRWENTRELRVCFYRGNPVVVELIRTVASEWNASSGVTFDFGPSGTGYDCRSSSVGFPEIRVSFSAGMGYWSYIGTDSERYGSDRAPSMNLYDFNAIYNIPRYSVANVVQQARPYDKSTIRHEFGHALGLLHEHQNPAMNCLDEINWKDPGNVYEYFAQPPNKWIKEDVDRNIGFIGATDRDYVAGTPDPLSIMIYSLPPAIFKKGAASPCAVPVNYEISAKDRAIVATLYPRSGVSAAPVSEAVEAAYIASAPVFSGAQEADDYLARVVVDLESDDTATRRNARSRLSQVLDQNVAPDAINELIATLPDGSYRYQLGVAAALSNVDGEIAASSDAADILSEQMSATNDSTLRATLQNVQQKLEIE